MLHLTLCVNVLNKALVNVFIEYPELSPDPDNRPSGVDRRDSKMADTSQQEISEPHTNGVVDGLTEEEKSKMRPADIDADMREMERRKRVEMMMNSRLFREELERIIETQMKDGAGPSGLLQQISDMMGAQGARFHANMFKNPNCVLPINDIRGVESMGYAKGEKLLRCKLAAIFRLLDLYGWTQGVGGQITARLNQDQEHFLVNPYGLLYHEVTASSLVKVDMQGAIVEQGTTNFGVHVTGFQLHSTIHAARPDIKCIVHLTTPSVIAVSSLKCGLLPLGQESIVIGEVSTHQYIGGSFEPEEREKISRNLGPINKVMFLTNRGAICCGETVEEAFYNVYNTMIACETQLKLMPVGLENLNLISEESKKAIFEASRKPQIPYHSSIAEPSPLAEKLEKRWRIGGAEFEALMRMLDNAGFRTGYIYRHPLVKSEPPRPRNDVEVPPAVSSLGYLLEEEELYKQGLWKGGRKGTDRSRWLNSPNVYQKVEILETGTPDPKKITKWVSDGSPTHSSTPVRIESALQFVPKNTNPKEFKQIQQQIKDYRRADKISAGPQSHILEGVTWEEAKKMQDATISGTGEQVVLVGAASKGIIQRGFQHNAMVYKTPYAKNPFDAVTDQELDQYKKDVERKQKGDPYDESQSESEALSSFNVSRATHESSTAKSPVQSPVSVTSETEEESRDEPRVLRIETKQVPAPSQPEVVLSDETLMSPTVSETPLVQHAKVQVQDTHRTIARHTPSVDATTEFLNEMRREAIEAPRNDLNRRGENTVNGDHSDAHHSTFSQSSKEGSMSQDVSVSEESPKKEKKKKKGLRTPSFLKKKKEKKKPVEA
ncbi:protein hu-li tai shao isoform X3 [Orussus abietinus]|uniref:protein hu-li tai shao isoform X3 n=1 Tax=Orussus abietinus TaxID=222816 RepID=UPI000625C8B3|nr:protein hu-li tai shao isoform X3 [Orussus abietinus]